LNPGPVPSLVTFQYDAKVLSSVQWNVGIQKTLPWASRVDVSYVGTHGYNRLGGTQGGTTVNLNAVDFGTAYLPKYQDPTLPAPATPGASALPSNLLRPYAGYGNIQQNTTEFWDQSHSIQTSFDRRFSHGFSASINHTLMLTFTGNTGLTHRLQHNPDGSVSVRADQAQYEELNKNLNLQRHIIKANAISDLPRMSTSGSVAHQALAQVVNGWQLSGIWTGFSGSKYDIGFSYVNSNNGSVNLTGSPDYGARIVYLDNGGGVGCSKDQYRQFNVSVAGPTYNSLGLESGRNVMQSCFNNVIDMRMSRNFRFAGGKQFSIEFDTFNTFNIVNINARNSTISLTSPTDQTVRNSQFLADGTLDQTKVLPKNAGFGAATGATAMRTARMYIRFQF